MRFVSKDKGESAGTVYALPTSIPEGNVLSFKESFYGCKHEEIGAGLVLKWGRSTATIFWPGTNLGTYEVTIVAHNIRAFNKLYAAALRKLGVQVNKI